ncbi:DUF4399 domain-containing protein [Alkalilimnicola ehrlichii MLHE-1]|uniref:DUF4399 domain-containing protein n=1 Tax=Alkalilimnicola ehrlichii (strain ATCC BAA-1101 / DSM 17681 / MLHE-1) TaxID=187272 RepID=Q0AC25_ALKEH|nr:DUF4399 domain-containing protein [Alkalilimnicola ehrlichii]ABI55612.1 conserved hypothetical protein [Alkalilimnicola ehrlichii MLHE-1]
MKLQSLARTSALLVLTGGLALAAGSATGVERISAPEDAKVYFISPQDGDTVESPVHVQMGLRGMGVAPAGLEADNTGHHHLLINKPLDEIDLDGSLPFTDQTRHFGGGQTEGKIELEPGTHTLQLLFMDYRHISFDPPVVSETIQITVE